MKIENHKIITMHKIKVQIMLIANMTQLKLNLNNSESKRGKALHLQIKQNHKIMN